MEEELLNLVYGTYGSDPKNPIKQYGYSDVQQGRHYADVRAPIPMHVVRKQDITKAMERVVAGEDEKDRDKVRNLLNITSIAENSYGANPEAYNRTYTHSFMSIDDQTLRGLFAKPISDKTGKPLDKHTPAKQRWFKRLEKEGLPTNYEEYKVLLDRDDPFAAMMAARMVYAESEKSLPSATDTVGATNYYYDIYNRGGADKYQEEVDLKENIINQYRKLKR